MMAPVVTSCPHVGQEEALSRLTNGDNYFITGDGGTGKSHILREYMSWCRSNGRNVVSAAPTAMAGINIGGTTLHRLFGLNSGCSAKTIEEIRKRLENADVVVVDEVSMVSANMIDDVTKRLSEFGLYPQIVTAGDFHQLPPVNGGNRYAFESDSWKSLNFKPLLLEENYRFGDELTCRLGHMARIGDTRCLEEYERISSKCIMDNEHYLCSRHEKVNSYNAEYVDELPGNERVYKAITHGYGIEDEDYTEAYARILTLKEGAEVMITVNDKELRYYNGMTGHIKFLLDDEIDIVTDSGDLVKIYRNKHFINAQEDQYIRQFPIKLARALTVHKAQGQTWDAVNLVADRFWENGHLYVALSRCRDVRNIHIVGELDPKYLKCSEKGKKFYDCLR